MSDIWLPDNQSVTVQWYITDQKRAVGVEHMSQEWRVESVPREPRLGFNLPREKQQRDGR